MTGRRMGSAALVAALLLLCSAPVAWAQEHEPERQETNVGPDGTDTRTVGTTGVTAGCG